MPDELQVHPQYRLKRGFEAVLRKVTAGLDDFITEKYQDQVAGVLSEWSSQLRRAPQDVTVLAQRMSANFRGTALQAGQLRVVNHASPFSVWEVQYPQEIGLNGEAFLAALRAFLGSFSDFLVAEFGVTRVHSEPTGALSSGKTVVLQTTIRFELVGTGEGFHREQRTGQWELLWNLESNGAIQLEKFHVIDETRCRALVPVFVDVTSEAFGRNPSYAGQLIPGADHWRTVLDAATGVDIYGHNGVTVGDVDGDGLDDVYVCQPAGLPNRLFRNRGDGTFEDITELSGVGILENTACALFADVDNDGRQDLIVVPNTGPLLFLNEGGGKFRLKPGAFQFANPPQGTFTGAAMADYDRDGWLDIYFCLYAYYQGADQYRYPMPYIDAENGPPNFLLRNNRDGTFRDVTERSGLNRNNTRFSFCCTWGDYNGDLWPDLYVVNDFGRKNLYRNHGDGTFTDTAREAGVDDVGAGMGAAWLDFDNDGLEDLYVADMWTAAGLRVSTQDNFQRSADPKARALYQKHSMGNSLFKNKGNQFEDVTARSGTAMGRWSWSCDSWDFDHDGYPDIYVVNGMISGSTEEDLNSFFWRQVVAASPNERRPNHEYEQGWNAINELIRSDYSWSGYERNVFFLNNRDGTFSDVSGIVGLDCLEDGRTFVLGDFDQDGRLEVILKNRNGPQLRYLKNVLPALGHSISFRLQGKKSNRDAVGARISIKTAAGLQTRTLRIGTGFLAQHSKELFFGLGSDSAPVSASIRWPSGLVQELRDLPTDHRTWIEEGSPPFRAEPFKTFLPAHVKEANPPLLAPNSFPRLVETWLLVPVLAPDFSLSDAVGRVETLSQKRGKPVLLHFWSKNAENWESGLRELERFQKEWADEGLRVCAIEIPDIERNTDKRGPEISWAYSFPRLTSSAEIIATYNLLFRQLFDRHRDMSIPVSFLVDSAGHVVKVYQGSVSKEHFETDFTSIPQTDSDRLAKALPFPGRAETYEYERNHLSLGFVFYERGYFEQAASYFRQAVKDNPKSAEALYGLGSAYLQQQEASRARECFQQALQLDAGYPGTVPNTWNNLGILAARSGDVTAAIEDFQQALKIDPDHSIALQNLGNAYRQKKQWPEAEGAFQHALALNPEDAESNYGLGLVYAQQNDTGRAYSYLQKALAARPVYPEALNNLGVLYLRTQRVEEAKHSFAESIRLAPEYDQSYLNLARVYSIEGDKPKAKAVLLELLKQHPDHVVAKEELKRLEP